MSILTKEQRAEIVSFEGIKRAKELGAKYGISVDAVTSIWHRAREASGRVPIPRMKMTAGGMVLPSRAFPWIDNQYTAWLSRMGEPDAEVPPEPLAIGGKPFIALDDQDCRWPIGVNREDERMFCALPRGDHPSRLCKFYCNEHAAMAILPTRAFVAPGFNFVDDPTSWMKEAA